MSKKIKENFSRRKVERTALSKSGTLISISNSQLLVRVFAFFEVLQTVCVCFVECSKLGGKCNFNSLKSFYFSRSISKLSKQIYISYYISASIFAPFFFMRRFFSLKRVFFFVILILTRHHGVECNCVQIFCWIVPNN